MMTNDEEQAAPLTKYITEATRKEVLRRDQYRCRRCGDMELANLQLHHVIFRSQRGGHDEDNLVTICGMCHRLLHDGKVTVIRVLDKWFFGGTSHWRGHFR
jgi:5-methylcytosine-specific restriction endonuclease McrA